MFTELMPLLKERAVMISLSDIGEGLLRVIIIPRKLEGASEENAALTSPLSVTGKPDELDRELPGQLASFTDSVVKTGSNLEELRTQHAAAVKAVEAENKKKLDEKRKTGSSKATPTTETKAVEFKDGKPVFGSKPTALSGESRSLFETASDEGEKQANDSAATDSDAVPSRPTEAARTCSG
jgi:PRTRC genetic system protein E